LIVNSLTACEALNYSSCCNCS